MFENTPENSLELQKRVEHKVPEALILKKASDDSERDISVFDLIAHYAGLRHWMRDIYINASGEEFIRTKYGFQPAVRHNKSLELAESKKIIEELQHKLKMANRKIKVCQDLLSILEERSKRRKEKIKVLLRPFQAENESLRHRINILSKELNRYKQTVGLIMNRLDVLYNQQSLPEEVVEIPPSNLDWSFEDEESIESILLRYKDMLS